MSILYLDSEFQTNSHNFLGSIKIIGDNIIRWLNRGMILRLSSAFEKQFKRCFVPNTSPPTEVLTSLPSSLQKVSVRA